MKRLVLITACGLSLAGASCDSDPCNLKEGTLDNAAHPTGSQTLAVSPDQRFVVTTNALEKNVTLLNASTLEPLEQLEIGQTPERIAPLGDEFVVSLRGERALARLGVENNRLVVLDRVETGAEPIGLVTSEDASKVYVAVSQSGVVEERRGSDLEVIRTFKIEHEPRWLALHPSGETLYVATAMGGHLVVVDLLTGEHKEQTLPSVSTFDEANGFLPIDRSLRITGDIAVRPNGRQLLIPALYIDNINPIGGEPNEDEPEGDGYGSSGSGKRFIAAVTTVNVDAHGKPDGTFKVQELEADQSGTQRGGYISSLAVHPEQDVAFATMEASRTLIAFRVSPTETRCTYGTSPSPPARGSRRTLMQPTPPMAAVPEPDGFDREQFAPLAQQRGFETERGPAGIAFIGAETLVHNRIDRSVQLVGTDAMMPEFVAHMNDWNTERPLASASLTAPALDERVQRGLGLFFSNLNPEVSGHNVNVSCSSCHFEGRNDGLTWQFADGPRQTPSLAGDVSLTEPVTWRDDVATVADEVRLTSQGRMGGEGLTGATQAAVTDYVNWRPHVDLPNKGADNAIIAEGRSLFYGGAGCGTCHSGEQYTDAEMHSIRGVNVRTPTLVGVAASAPYFHNGSAATLRELLEQSRDGQMGTTGNLTDAQMGALEAFLTSL